MRRWRGSTIRKSASSANQADAELGTNPALDSRGIPWPLFVSLLVANGWFIEPRPFPYIPGRLPAFKRVKRAALRIPFFIAAWVIAFATLPAAAVGLVFVAWAAWLTPGVRFINKQFQNVPVTG